MRHNLLLLLLLCFAPFCFGQWNFIAHADCLLYPNATISKAILEVCGQDFVNQAINTRYYCCAVFVITHDSSGNVIDVRLSQVKHSTSFSETDIKNIKCYLIQNKIKVFSCPYMNDLEKIDGIDILCSENRKNEYKNAQGYFETYARFPGFSTYVALLDSAERLTGYLEWIDKHLYPNCLPMCEPCGCNSMSEMTNDYIFQQLSIGYIMSSRLLKEYVQQTEEVKLKFLYELSHPQHCDSTIIEKCVNSVKDSFVLSDFEKQRMLKALSGK